MMALILRMTFGSMGVESPSFKRVEGLKKMINNGKVSTGRE